MIKGKVYASKYSAGLGAIPYMAGEPKTGLTKVVRNKWAYFYKNGKLIWDCNDRFAAVNFIRERKIWHT
jgi:hypothetical protein